MSGVIQISCLGSKGRFGHQLFQYAFAKKYAQVNNCELQVPKEWIGRTLFTNVQEPPIDPSLKLPVLQDTELYTKPSSWKKVNVDLSGYFQDAKATLFLSRKECREWYKLKPEIDAKVTRSSKLSVVAHLRRGDYVSKDRSTQAIITRESVYAGILAHGYPPTGIRWMSDGEIGVHDIRFPPAYDFIGDFIVMLRAKALFRANSSFSYWAGVLIENGKVYSPVFEGQGWLDAIYVEGNEPSIFGGGRLMPMSE